MTHGEMFRRWLTAGFNVAALAIILMLTTDHGERALLCFVAWKLAMELAVWLAMREWTKRPKGLVRFELACACALLALLPAREPVSRVSTTYTGKASLMQHLEALRR